jgi:hypothetical protein
MHGDHNAHIAAPPVTISDWAPGPITQQFNDTILHTGRRSIQTSQKQGAPTSQHDRRYPRTIGSWKRTWGIPKEPAQHLRL